MEQQLVVFELSNEFYGINIAMIESITKMQAITQLPQTPSYVKGVTNLRGSVLPVMICARALLWIRRKIHGRPAS